jgi:hypothetical protein
VTDNPYVVEPGHAPTPFTADEIRDASPPGQTLRLRVEVHGQAPFIRLNRYVEVDAEGASVERSAFSMEGEPLGPPEMQRMTWLQLQRHASFPLEATRIEQESIDTPMGRLDCLRYTVGEGDSVQTFWFATALPGMPVKFMSTEAGRTTSVVTMLEKQVSSAP